jgi:hypothetical protein
LTDYREWTQGELLFSHGKQFAPVANNFLGVESGRIAMSEARPNAHHTPRGVARISVALTAAAIATLVATSGGLAEQNNQGGNNQGGNSQGQNVQGAPAPAIGSGLSTVMVLGGVLLGATLFRRRGQASGPK